MSEIKLKDKGIYRTGFDDRCLVISSGTKEDAPKIWLSREMVEWIADVGKDQLKDYLKFSKIEGDVG